MSHEGSTKYKEGRGFEHVNYRSQLEIATGRTWSGLCIIRFRSYKKSDFKPESESDFKSEHLNLIRLKIQTSDSEPNQTYFSAHFL